MFHYREFLIHLLSRLVNCIWLFVYGNLSGSTCNTLGPPWHAYYKTPPESISIRIKASDNIYNTQLFEEDSTYFVQYSAWLDVQRYLIHVVSLNTGGRGLGLVSRSGYMLDIDWTDTHCLGSQKSRVFPGGGADADLARQRPFARSGWKR